MRGKRESRGICVSIHIYIYISDMHEKERRVKKLVGNEVEFHQCQNAPEGHMN